jgi:non-canonical (house-cleaning) NTP pyrophosphatase
MLVIHFPSKVVGSTSKIKIAAVEKALKTAFPSLKFQVIGTGAASEVSDQPLSAEVGFCVYSQ